MSVEQAKRVVISVEKYPVISVPCDSLPNFPFFSLVKKSVTEKWKISWKKFILQLNIITYVQPYNLINPINLLNCITDFAKNELCK